MARDFRREIFDAVQAGDLAALSNIAHVLLGHVEADDERRERQADKKRKQRENRAVPGQTGTSGMSGMSPNVPGRPGTNGDVPPVVHNTKELDNNNRTPPPASQVIAKLGDVKLQTALDRLRELMADQWEDVASFLLRRKYVSWQGWVDSMLRELGPGSQYAPADLVQVCRDDPTLEKPIGSAYALRTFLGYARVERMRSREPPTNGRPSKAAAVEAKPNAGAAMFARIRGLVVSQPDPRQGTVKFIPIGEVKKLGDVALRAYKAIGGADRVINTLKTPDKMFFLEREYAEAFARAEAEGVHV